MRPELAATARTRLVPPVLNGIDFSRDDRHAIAELIKRARVVLVGMWTYKWLSSARRFDFFSEIKQFKRCCASPVRAERKRFQSLDFRLVSAFVLSRQCIAYLFSGRRGPIKVPRSRDWDREPVRTYFREIANLFLLGGTGRRPTASAESASCTSRLGNARDVLGKVSWL
jgi:hypothetical protein